MFRIVFVCSGNRCRSPLAEVHLRHLVGDLPVEVSSVGTLDIGPAPAVPEMLEVARAAGLDLSAHRARTLAAVDISQADLVIGLDRGHVAAAVVEGNAPYEKVFTFKEIVRLLEGIEPPEDDDVVQQARSAVARAHERRASGPDFVPGEDIADPFGGPRQGYVALAEEVEGLCRRLLAGLVGGEVAARARGRSR